MSNSILNQDFNIFQELNQNIRKVSSTFALMLSIGFCLLFINDIIDQAHPDFNYEKFNIKCLVSTGLVLFFTLIFTFLYYKLNNDVDEYSASATSPSPAKFKVMCKTTLREQPDNIGKIIAENNDSWSVTGSLKGSQAFTIGNQFWIKQREVETYFCMYLTQTNFENNCVTIEKYFTVNDTNNLHLHPEVKNFISLSNFVTENSK